MPPKRPGPRSKTLRQEDREQQEESPPPAPPPEQQQPPLELELEQGSGPPSSRASSSRVYRCKYCGRIFGAKIDLGYHKMREHSDEASHITTSTVTGPIMRPGFRLPFVPPRPVPPSPSSGPPTDEDSEPEPGPSRRKKRKSSPPRSSRRPQENDTDSEPEPGPSRRRSPPPPKPKRGRSTARREEEVEYVDPVPALRNQGRNKPPKMYGRKKRVRGPDGVERVEYERAQSTPGG